MRFRASAVAFAVAGLGLVGCLIAARARQDALTEERSVRRTAFAYYSGVLLGDADQCAGAARAPLVSIRDGRTVIRDETALRTLVADVRKRTGAPQLSKEDRDRMAAHMLQVFDSADVRFLGGSTATVVFVVKPRTTDASGDYLGELVLAKVDGKWRVVAEVTDSKPAPRPPDLDEPPPGRASPEQRAP
jgi:hypothetical protein